MNTHHTERDIFADSELDRLLEEQYGGDALVSSSGFAATVMEAIRAEAFTPEPIPFPWRRVAPGILIVLGILIAFAAWIARQWGALTHEVAQLHGTPTSLGDISALPSLGTAELMLVWVLLAVTLSAVTVFASLRMTSRG